MTKIGYALATLAAVALAAPASAANMVEYIILIENSLGR